MTQRRTRYATAADRDFICKLERRNYGKDGWAYTPEDFLRRAKNRDPVLANETSTGSVIRVYGTSYLEYSVTSRGHYLVSFGGKARGPGRFYTHAKPEWHRGKTFDILRGFGFKNIGPGDNARETGKWRWI